MDWFAPYRPMPIDDLVVEPAEQQVRAHPKMPPMLQHPRMLDAEVKPLDGVAVLKVDGD